MYPCVATCKYSYLPLHRPNDMGLAGIPKEVPRWLFRSLTFTGIALVISLLLLTLLCAYSYYTWFICKYALKGLRKCCAKETPFSCKTKQQTCSRKCAGHLLPILNWGSRKIIAVMFPGLFKEHKERHQNLNNNLTEIRVSLLFLDRKLENNFAITFSFFLLAIAIVTSALLVFFRHIPVSISSECLEKDDQFRDLFCYTNGSNWPVNCTIYNSTELEEVKFVCYAISILELGIAVAAVLALAKIATVFITIYTKVSEAVYLWSRGNTRQYCGLSAKRVYRIYHVVTFVILESFFSVSSVMIAFLIANRWVKSPAGRWSVLAYLAYILLTLMLIPFSIPVMCNLSKHCDQEEYISRADQLPFCVQDCDAYVESGSNHDELEDPSFLNNFAVVEYVDPRPIISATPSKQAGKERPNENNTAPNDTDSCLESNHPSHLTPLLQDHLTLHANLQPPDSQA